MDSLDDNSGLHHQQELEAQEWMEREYDIAFGSFAKDFDKFFKAHENERLQETTASKG